MIIPGIQDIKQATRRITGFAHRTPLMHSTAIDAITGAHIYFKCENFQKTGSFKFRGACNAVEALPEEEAFKGVCTHSSGNFAQALALAAKMRGIPAYIVMPENVPDVKINAVKGYGGKFAFCEANLEARESELKKVQIKTGASFLHPYDTPDVIAGQGSCTREIVEDTQNLDCIMAPVGGGGLISGSILARNSFQPGLKIFGAEPAMADDAARSLERGKLIPSVNPDTIADGLLTSLSQRTFHIISEGVERILTCSEEAIKEAMVLMMERMKLIVEPSGAVPLATVLEHPELFRSQSIALIISGGNLDIKKWNTYLY